MYSVIRFCDGCHRDSEFNSTDGRQWQCQTCAYRCYGPLTAAQDRETGRPGPITRGPLTIRLYRRTPRREVCAAGTFLDRSQPPDN